MKQIIKFGFILGFISNSAFSTNPVQGLYFGLLGQISHASPNPQLNVTINGEPFTGTVQLAPVGGGLGASLGYKIQNVRLEGEFLFNINTYGEFKIGSCTLLSPNVVGPRGICPLILNGTGFNGNIMGFYGLFNAFYDFDFMYLNPNLNFIPYLGLGLGGGLIKNTANFQTTEFSGLIPAITSTTTNSNFGFALQGIVGFNYYLDDFTTLGIDFRYLTTVNTNKNSTTTSTTSSNSQVGISTINVVATFALERNNGN